jgi:hypothetical protein
VRSPKTRSGELEQTWISIRKIVRSYDSRVGKLKVIGMRKAPTAFLFGLSNEAG